MELGVKGSGGSRGSARFDIQILRNVAALGVGAPPLYEVPPYGKSWIRHWKPTLHNNYKVTAKHVVPLYVRVNSIYKSFHCFPISFVKRTSVGWELSYWTSIWLLWSNKSSMLFRLFVRVRSHWASNFASASASNSHTQTQSCLLNWVPNPF